MRALVRLRLHAALGLIPALMGIGLAYGLLTLCSAMRKIVWSESTAAEPGPASPEEIRVRVDDVLRELKEADDVRPVHDERYRPPPPLLAPSRRR